MNTIKIKYGLEEITSRIPGLFPYLEFDENHVSTIHPASDSKVGCYGKIVCAIKIPLNVNLDVNNVPIIIGGNVYTYNTLMFNYYTYRDNHPTNTFIQFMERGIGRFKIADLLPPDSGIDLNECILIPEYEYYANVKTIYSEYVKIKIMCDKYNEIKSLTGEINCELECLLDKYSKMGGDVMLNFYYDKIPYIDQITQEYYEYANDDEKMTPFNLLFDLNIVSNNKDLGILNTFIDFFNPDEKYYHGQQVIYNDRTYVCTVDEGEYHTGPWDITHFHLISDTDQDNQETSYIETFSSTKYYHKGEFVRLNDYDQVYVCDLPEYVQYEPNEVINIGDTYYVKFGDEYLLGTSLELPHTVESGEEYYHKGPEMYHGDWSYDIFKPTVVNGITDSKLTGFRNNNHYIDAGGNIQRPSKNTDWLWFYKIGDVGFYETTTDELNNIELLSGQRVNLGEYETKLMAYGDIMLDITRNTDDYTITFTYIIGAHLKAKYIHNYPDDDGNPHYCYDDFEYDENDNHGVKYTETYTYAPNSEIDLLSDENFRKYVTPERRINDVYSKCEFSTKDNNRTTNITINGAVVERSFIVGTFSSEFDNEMDTLCSNLTKLDYLTGIPYNPHVKNDVHIRRGNSAAWERHIKLGEVRTFEDLESYSNGGFFNLR